MAEWDPQWREVAATSMAGEADDPRVTRRHLREQAVLLALPAMWVGREPTHIAADLLRVLLSLLDLESAYIRLDDPVAETPLEHWLPRGARPPAELARLLADGPSRDRGQVMVSRPVTSASGTVRVVRLRPALPGEAGLVLASSARPDFPTALELHLLRVAVGQATVSIRAARMLAAERAARLMAEEALRRRDALLDRLERNVADALGAVGADIASLRAITTSPETPMPAIDPAPAQVPGVGGHASGAADPAAMLTRREAEVLGLLAQGLSNKEIAAELWLSDRTVERHITSLYAKIGVRRRTEATLFALHHGFGDPPDNER